MDRTISLKELRPKLPTVIRRVDQSLERYVISKRGRPTAVILGIDDYESMIETLNETQDLEGLKRIKKAIREARKGKLIPWKTVRTRLGL